MRGDGLFVCPPLDETEGAAVGHILVKVVKDVAAFGTARFDERL